MPSLFWPFSARAAIVTLVAILIPAQQSTQWSQFSIFLQKVDRFQRDKDSDSCCWSHTQNFFDQDTSARFFSLINYFFPGHRIQVQIVSLSKTSDNKINPLQYNLRKCLMMNKELLEKECFLIRKSCINVKDEKDNEHVVKMIW